MKPSRLIHYFLAMTLFTWKDSEDLMGSLILLRILPPAQNGFLLVRTHEEYSFYVLILGQDICFFFYLAFKENTTAHSSPWQLSWCQETMTMPPGVLSPCHTGYVSSFDLPCLWKARKAQGKAPRELPLPNVSHLYLTSFLFDNNPLQMFVQN